MTPSHDHQTRPAYGKPHADLLEIGEIVEKPGVEWRDYVRDFGFGPEHVADLIRMVRDDTLNHGKDEKLFWAPVHAWRALGQLRAVEAIAPLLDHLRTEAHDDDLVSEDFPVVFGMIGPEAITAIDAFVAENKSEEEAQNILMSAFAEIGARHPEARATCVDSLQRILARTVDFNPLVNGFALSALLDLKAVEAIDTIRDALRRDVVDVSIAGDIEDVEIHFGQREKRSKPRRPNPIFERLAALNRPEPPWRDAKSPLLPDSAPATSTKVGRNEPCPCGSGKKYKKCCLE